MYISLRKVSSVTLFMTEAGSMEIAPATELHGVLRSNPSWEMVINGSSAAMF